MSTMLRDSGAGAYSNAVLGFLAMGSVQREVVGAGVAAGLHLGALHEQLVEQGGGAEAEPVRVQPVGTGDLVDHHEVLDGVLRRADAAGGLHPDHLAGLLAEVAGCTLPVEVLMKWPPAIIASQLARRTLS